VEVGESAIPGAEFDVPDFVNDPLDLRRVALVVIGALEKWEKVEGLGGESRTAAARTRCWR
jgi:hypothetical protein